MNNIGVKEVERKVENNEATLIEVLDPKQYKKEHIKGAINIPYKEISNVAKQKFDKNDSLIVYCSDENCEASNTAAKKLEKSGFTNVYHFAGGKKEWKDQGLPMQ